MFLKLSLDRVCGFYLLIYCVWVRVAQEVSPSFSCLVRWILNCPRECATFDEELNRN